MNLPIALNATDDFGVTDFDWDDTPGITIGEVGVDAVQEAVQAALRSNDSTFGWTYLLRDDLKPTKGRLFRAKHYMDENHRKFFEKEWPAYTFVWDAAICHHDHPRSHLANELNEIEALEDWVKEDEVFADLFGNAGRAKKYNRNCVVLRQKNTPKEYIRQQYSNGRCADFSMDALCDPESTTGKIDRVFLNQALYYLTIEDVARIVHTSDRRVIRAVVHRHKDTWGTMNAGEQEYRVSEGGTVVHTNVDTGEHYEHPSLEAMFRQYSARTPFGGVTWTTRRLGADAYQIEIVGCPNEICEEYKPLKFLTQQSWEEYTYSNIRVRKTLGWLWMTAETKQGVVRIEDLDLFNKLRRYAACKQRTPRLHTEMANLARRLTNKADIISIHGGGCSDIPVASMSDYVEVAKYIDMRHELELAVSMYKENHEIATALNKYYEDGTMPKDFTRVTKVLSLARDATVTVASSVAKDISMPVMKGLGVAPYRALFDAPGVTETLANGIGYALEGNLTEKRTQKILTGLVEEVIDSSGSW